jgi:predicted dehydrogenase
MRVGLIGAGRQGFRRANAIKNTEDKLVIIADINLNAAKSLAYDMKCEATLNWKEVVKRKDIDIVVVTTPNHLHAPISITALKNGKHVLCEKPLARTPEEAKKIVDIAMKTKMKLKCGFTLRHHPGIRQARKWFDENRIGELMFLRCYYGMCGRMGYERDWRANREISGGGELLDQGIHALDLFRWFAGDFSQVIGFTATTFWNTPVEDNAFVLLRTDKGQIASLQASWTQWKNLFLFEIYGRDGYIIVEGLGGSYGTERAMLGKRSFSEPFTENIVEFRGGDVSWLEEWREFVAAIKEDREPLGNGSDGLEALRLVHAAYESNNKGSRVKL